MKYLKIFEMIDHFNDNTIHNMMECIDKDDDIGLKELMYGWLDNLDIDFVVIEPIDMITDRRKNRLSQIHDPNTKYVDFNDSDIEYVGYYTPLIYCTDMNARNCYNLLLDNGADINKRDGNDVNVLSAAMIRVDRLYFAIDAMKRKIILKDSDFQDFCYEHFSFQDTLLTYYPHYVSKINDCVLPEIKQKYKMLFNMEGAGLL